MYLCRQRGFIVAANSDRCSSDSKDTQTFVMACFFSTSRSEGVDSELFDIKYSAIGNKRNRNILLFGNVLMLSVIFKINNKSKTYFPIYMKNCMGNTL
eukprot:GAHX01001282.1.p1 GENE.GAHX01001282.1~~GAHX01001282.1.p1  ORF type:complete len:98 (-),score=5.91 GAHX01001282.1:149-442(-)